MAAASVLFVVVRSDQDQRILGDVVSAHLRSLQAEHLTDVPSTDQHTVKPWFNGKLARRTAGRGSHGAGLHPARRAAGLQDGKAVAAIVYRRRVHVINLFVAQRLRTSDTPARKVETVQGFNIRRWSEQGLRFIAISDINADELAGIRRRNSRTALARRRIDRLSVDVREARGAVARDARQQIGFPREIIRHRSVSRRRAARTA